MRSHDKTHERRRLCFIASQRYGEVPCPRNRLRAVSSWVNLGARERQQFRHAVRLIGITKRNKALLELFGTVVPSDGTASERTSPEAPKDGTEGNDVTQRSIPGLQRRRNLIAL